MIVDSPIGRLQIVATERGVRRIDFLNSRASLDETSIRGDCEYSVAAELEVEAAGQIGEYFAGARRDFDLPLDLRGSEFQRSCWTAIASIPFGETLTYADVASAVGAPGAYRAAGSACAHNPIVIVVPCHRVVGSDGKLHGFGGGLDTKAWLLKFEGARLGAGGREQLALV
jgi:methylated-DNA-[protein]-cysteine S-methyltransferase